MLHSKRWHARESNSDTIQSLSDDFLTLNVYDGRTATAPPRPEGGVVARAQVVMWQGVDFAGAEYLNLRQSDDGILANSVVLGVMAGRPFRLAYALRLDTRWRVREARLMIDGGAVVHLLGDGEGHWSDGNGQPRPELDGCIDVDIRATPFTNTLPIRRLDWRTGQSETLKMVFFSLPDLTVTVDPQRYTCLERTADSGRFRFDSIDSDFTVELPVDADGLVLDYPGLFTRLWPR